MDPDRLVGVKTAQEAVPTFTRLKKEGPSGSLYMPMVGGGTANCEFEVLTGMNTDFFGVGEYPYNTIVRETACESIAFNSRNTVTVRTSPSIFPARSIAAMKCSPS